MQKGESSRITVELGLTCAQIIAAAMIAASLAAPASVLAEPQRNPDRQRCGETQDTESRERCERPWARVDQNFSVLTEPGTCAKDRENCGDSTGHSARPPRPPYWIGHHYSGL